MKTVCGDIVDDDSDEQEILQVDGGENEPPDSEIKFDIGTDSCAAEFEIPSGLVNSPVGRSEGSRRGMLYR